MSHYSRAELLDLLRSQSSFLSSLNDTTVGFYLDAALRAYSERCPSVRVSEGNTYDSDVALYDYPTGALSISALWETDTRREIEFAIENQTGTPQIRPFYGHQPSYQALLSQDYYRDPVSYAQGENIPYTFTSFDIEYVALQTAATISDTALDALLGYCEAKALEAKLAMLMTDISASSFAEITDRDATGSSTTIRGGADLARGLDAVQKLARAKMETFDAATHRPYGTRG